MGVKVGVGIFSWGQSIGIDETNTFQLTFFSSMKIVGGTGLGGLWALEWAWQPSYVRNGGAKRIVFLTVP